VYIFPSPLRKNPGGGRCTWANCYKSRSGSRGGLLGVAAPPPLL